MSDTQIRVGMSGWTYPPWRGVFYPEKWPQKRELEFASRQVNSIELNGSFYSLQKPKSYQAWYDATPEGFVFSVKAPQFITHIRRLKEVETPLANFFASGPLALNEKLGPILWQLPPSFQYDRMVVEKFLKLLPHDTKEASAVAGKHDDYIRGHAWLKTDKKRPVRHAMEVRNASFENKEFVSLLRDYNVAVVIADAANEWPVIEDATADFLYLRLHGHEKLYVSGYTDKALDHWARKVRTWSEGSSPADARLLSTRPAPRKEGREVYVYFDNDAKVKSPRDAMALASRLGLGKGPEEPAFEGEPGGSRSWPPLLQRWNPQD